MREQYIKQVKKELHLPRKAKKEIVRDLNEVFTSALEHGETEQQIIERLGAPKVFAANTEEQLGAGSTIPKYRKDMMSGILALVVSVVSFVIYGMIQSQQLPDGVIGQADAMTTIQIEGIFRADISYVILAIGFISIVIAAIQFFRSICKNRRQP